jgi:hypothetical protein
MPKRPAFRKLRGYAFDPSLSLKMDTVSINDIVYKIPWEDVIEGPIGEYLEVVDYDPAFGKFYQPVDLNNPFILAQDGLDPSESNPMFHQQMVYAVAMLTIKNFEKALGRKILWASRRLKDPKKYEEPVWRLRIYPHALREANAYYSPVKKSLLFGYFASTPADETRHMPDSLVFTCLSHDIIAHETTHAILDGMHNFYNEPTNPDMLAFHEAFADIVALFQHFSFPEVLKHQIAKTKGDLGTENLLGQLAQEFGNAVGGYGSLRDAIGSMDEETNTWKPAVPDPEDYKTIMEPHARGSILVAAVFEAFLNIYKRRVADLVRLASEGTGILRQGEIHPDLVNRLAQEASKSAGHVLGMCIRALDYCPPVDLTFGDFLRAIITGDVDMVADDSRNYRLAFIEAFRKRGIYPEGIKTLSVDSLRFDQLSIKYLADATGTEIKTDVANEKVGSETRKILGAINGFLKEYADEVKYKNNRVEIYNITKKYIRGEYNDTPRGQVDIIQGLHRRIDVKFSRSEDFAKLTGLAFVENFSELGVQKSKRYKGPTFQIQNLRLVSRVGPHNNQVNHVIFSIYQKSGVRFFEEEFLGHYQPPLDPVPGEDSDSAFKTPEHGFILRGGCTLIFDLDNMELKYAITKPLLNMEAIEQGVPMINMKRVESQYNFQYGEDDTGSNEFSLYFGDGVNRITEPFAFLHQHT